MNNNIGKPATEKIASSIKDFSYYGVSPVAENKGNQYIKGQYDLLPNNITTESLEQDDEISSYIKSVYGNAAGGKGFSSEDRFIVDVLASTVFGVDYMEVATHRDKYIPLLVGRTDLDDKQILEAWADNWKSYGYQKKLAKKMNEFDRSKDEEEKMILLEEMESINNEIFKLGDYNSRNAIGRGFTQSASITRQGLTTLGWTAAGAMLAGGLVAIAGGAAASSAIPAAVSALKVATAASKIGKFAGLSADVLFNTFATERGSLSYELYNAVDEEGNRLDDSIRNMTATLGAIAISAIEYINFPDQSINNFIKGNVAKEVVKKASVEWAKDFGIKSLKRSVGESFEEAVQSFVSNISKHTAKSYSDTTRDTKFNLKMQEEFFNYLKGAVDSFASSFLPSFFAGAPGNIRESLGTFNGFKNSESIEIEPKKSHKDAKKLQNVNSESTVISFDKINLKSEAPTGQYGTTTDANGKETKTKLDAIKVMRDPEDRSRYIPVNEDEMDKAKWLRNQRAKGLAVEIVDSNDNISVDKDSWERAVAGYSGTIEGNAITFASESEMKAFDEFAKKEGIGKSLNGEYLITGDDGSTLAYSATVDGTIENARAHEVLKTVEPKVSMDIRKAFDDAGAKISDRELALVSKVASSFGNLGNLTITSENDANLTAEERDQLIGSRGIVSFSVSEVGISAKIILSKDADASTVVHEMFHVALKTNKTARTDLVNAYKEALRDSRESLKAFYENHFEIVRDSNVQSVDDALTILDMMTEDNVLSDSMFQELLTKTFEAFWADNTMMEDANLSTSIKNFFKQLSELFKSIYKSLTGRDLTTLPKNVETAYMGFMGEKSNLSNDKEVEKQEILHQDILDTTLLDEGAARRKFDDFKEADVVADIDANVFIPDFLLDKYSGNPTVEKEIKDREQIMNMVSDKEKLLAVRSESIGAFISELKEFYGDALNEELERLYRKFYTYANTQTPQQMREWFRSTFSTIDKLMELKAMLSPRRVAKRQNGKVINALYVPKTSYVYSLIRDLNLNSPKEDVDKILDSIKKDTNVWVKAYIRSKADYQKFRAFENNSAEYLQSLAEIAYLSLSDAEFDFLKTIRNANDDGTVAEDKKELRELRKELKAFGSIPENDETYIEASKHFYEDALEALREEIGEEAYRVALEKDRKYEAEIESIRKKLAEKQYDAITMERWLAKKRLLEKQREAEMLLLSTKNAAKIRQDKIKEKYEIRIDKLKKDRDQIISDLKVMRNLKLHEQEIYWRNSKAQAILRERNWRKISEARIKAHYDHRIKALQLRMMYREASAKLDKNIKNKLSINLKTHDAYALETIKYVANLIVRKNYYGMDAAEFERYKTRTGKEDPDDIIFEYVDVDDNGKPIVDEDGNEKMFQFHYNPGAENYSKDTIPVAMLPYLSQATIDKLHSDDFAWYKLDIAEKENILDALIGVRNEAKASMEYKHAKKAKENIDISSKMVASIIKQDDPLTPEFRARIAEALGMKGTEPNFEQKAQTYFAQHIDQFITPPEKPKKYLGFVASTFGHIQSIAYALDGNKEGPIYDLFVNRVQKAVDNLTRAVNKRFTEAKEAFDAIWESGDISKADKMKWFGAKYVVSTNSMDNGKKNLTGWNLMGAYIYSQNVHGFVKLVSDKGNNISMEEMARINPEDTFKMIEEDLKQRKEFREHEVSRMEYHAKRGTQFVPQRYEGLLWTFSEVELVRIKGLIETGHIKSMMPQFAKDMGNKMIELLSKYTDDMNKAAYELYNMPFTEQRRYFPLVGYVNTKDVSLTEFMQSKKSVSHGFIKERRMNRDYELLLDPMAVFYSAIEAQERMVHLTKVVNQMNSALSPHEGNLSKIVEERYGSKMSNYLNTQLRVLAGESAYKMADWEKMANAVLQNLAVSKIGLNFMTSLKQFGSLITAMTDGEINIADFIRQFGMDRDAKASLYETLAPDLAESSIELDIARMKKANQTTKAGTKIAQIQDFSMKLTQNVDQMVKKWVWTASYIKSVEQGMNESDAAIKATALVKRTQSISSEYDLSQIQRNKNPLAKAAFMFTNDLFQMWNRLALGIPSDIKSKNYWRAFEKGLGSVMVAGFLGLAACGWLPEEEEGKFDEKSFLNDLLQNLMAFTPLAGTAMEDAVSGMRSNLTNFPTELITLVRMPFKGSEEYELEDYVDQLYDTFIGAVGFTGLPTLTADRAMKLFFPNGIDEGFDFNAGNFAYLFVGSRAGDFFHRLADEHR